MVGTVTDVDVQDSEDGTQYVMTVKQKDNQGGESSKDVRFSKYTDDDKVVVNIDLTDSGGAGLPSQQYLALGSGFVVKYSVGVGTAGGGTVDGYSDLKARVIVKRGSTVISELILRGCGYCRWRYGGRLQRPESPRDCEARFDRDQ